jgi:hypothetical protein
MSGVDWGSADSVAVVNALLKLAAWKRCELDVLPFMAQEQVEILQRAAELLACHGPFAQGNEDSQ